MFCFLTRVFMLSVVMVNVSDLSSGPRVFSSDCRKVVHFADRLSVLNLGILFFSTGRVLSLSFVNVLITRT